MAATTRPAITRMRYALDRGANSLSVSSTAIGIAAHSPLSDELLRRDGQSTIPLANRIKDRIGARCGDAGRAQLAYPFTADRARFLVDLLDTGDRYVRGDVGVHRDRNAGEVFGEESSESGIEWTLFHRGHAPAPDYPSYQLGAGCARVHDAADAIASDDTAQTQQSNRAIDAHLAKAGAKGAHGIARAVLGRIEGARAYDLGLAGLIHDVPTWDPLGPPGPPTPPIHHG